MQIHEVIEVLSKLDPKKVLKKGLLNPHSYRGYYEELGVELSTKPSTVGDVLDMFNSCLGGIFEGYKGGDYMMHNVTDVYIADYGHCGEELTKRFLFELLDITTFKITEADLERMFEKAKIDILNNLNCALISFEGAIVNPFEDMMEQLHSEYIDD